MTKQNVRYETMIVFSTQSGDDGVAALKDKFHTLIAENGTIDNVEEWGKRRLAYPINDELEGYYLLIDFTSNADFPSELERVYKITDGILRTLVVCKDEKADAKKAEKS